MPLSFLSLYIWSVFSSPEAFRISSWLMVFWNFTVLCLMEGVVLFCFLDTLWWTPAVFSDGKTLLHYSLPIYFSPLANPALPWVVPVHYDSVSWFLARVGQSEIGSQEEREVRVFLLCCIPYEDSRLLDSSCISPRGGPSSWARVVTAFHLHHLLWPSLFCPGTRSFSLRLVSGHSTTFMCSLILPAHHSLSSHLVKISLFALYGVKWVCYRDSDVVCSLLCISASPFFKKSWASWTNPVTLSFIPFLCPLLDLPSGKFPCLCLPMLVWISYFSNRIFHFQELPLFSDHSFLI